MFTSQNCIYFSKTVHGIVHQIVHENPENVYIFVYNFQKRGPLFWPYGIALVKKNKQIQRLKR